MKKAIDNVTLPRKEYMRPTMKVVPIHHKSRLLIGSEVPTLQGSKGSTDEESTYYELQ